MFFAHSAESVWSGPPLPPEPVDDSLESTLMMAPEEAAALAEAARSELNSANQPSEDDEHSAPSQYPPVATHSIESRPSESADVSVDDIPAPSILTSSSRTADNIVPTSTSEYLFPDNKETKSGQPVDQVGSGSAENSRESRKAEFTPAGEVPMDSAETPSKAERGSGKSRFNN